MRSSPTPYWGACAWALAKNSFVVQHGQRWSKLSFWMIAAAMLIYIFGVIVFTQQVNLPLNATTEAWDPTYVPADWEQIRQHWNYANDFRVLAS
ncbi:MAG: DUF1772 domain-containing protein [Chloroflexota bacterium]